MHWLRALFIAALLAATATRIWLATRQIAAVRVHRDRVPEYFAGQIALADQQKAADYNAARASFTRVAAVVDALLRLALTLGGGIALADALWLRLRLAQPWHGALVTATVVLAWVLCGLPLAAWRIFQLEERFGFNRATPALFAADVVRRVLLGAALGLPVVLGALALMERGGRSWWLAAWLGWTAYSLALTWAFPRFVAPLFNRFTPLPDGALKSSVEALVARCGFASRGVFVMDGSRRSAHGNAYFTGLGRNKRIVFLDTLLDRLGGEEVEAVLAHELGHFRLKHVRARFVVSLLVSFGALASLAWAAREPAVYAALGVPSASAHAALLLAAFATPPFWFFVTPLRAWWSRRHEFQADDFAVEHADARALADALVKLYRANAATLTPDPVHSAFYDTHPPATRRIARLDPRRA
jgi:STE24 endopeptidase